MHLTKLDLLLWALAFIEHFILLAVLIYFQRFRSYPVFTTLIAANVVRTIVLYLTLHLGFSSAYFYIYWALAIVDVILQLGVAYEVAAHVFQPLGTWATDTRRSLVAMIVLGFLVATGLTWLSTPPTDTVESAIVIRGNFFASALMSEIFVAMIALSVTLGFPWRTHVARIAQGFGLYSILGIFTDAAHNYLGSGRLADHYKLISHIEIEFYLSVLVYWIVSLSLKEPKPRRLPEELRQELRALQTKVSLMLQNLRSARSAL